MWKEYSMDPIGQSYLPGYFCPAALFDSRENHARQGEGGAETHREITVPRISNTTKGSQATLLPIHKGCYTKITSCNVG